MSSVNAFRNRLTGIDSPASWNPGHVRVPLLGALLVFLTLTAAQVSLAQEAQPNAANMVLINADQASTSALESAPVVVNGEALFRVIGTSTFPPKQRAAKIAARIVRRAKNPDYDPSKIRIERSDAFHQIYAGDDQKPIMGVFDVDAALEGIDRETLSQVVAKKIKRIIKSYRRDRQPEIRTRNLLLAAVNIFLLFAGIAVVNWAFKKLGRTLDTSVKGKILNLEFKGKILNLEAKSLRIIQGNQLWRIIQSMIRTSRFVLNAFIVYFFLSTTLHMFPETRYFAKNLLNLVISPLKSMGSAVIGYIPNLFFLIILIVVLRFLLKLLKQVFWAIDKQKIVISGFEAEWAFPTFRIVRVIVILFGVVLAYPYIPGSNSQAFKGLSIMVGVLFSLGSTSVISNIIAGYTMTYRRAFSVGDRVTIAGTTGDVMEMRVLVTHLRSLKNEEIIVPNSTILNNEVINYSKMVREKGLILHTNVGIGYEVPWRQVEEMLRIAADRTSGLLKEPKPFVHQVGLGDFAINYELNAYCNDEKQAVQLYTDLHRNIQDVFNEYGIQIMTPNYVADTPDEKLVPKDRWYVDPAKPAESSS